MAERVTARLAATRRDRLTSRLPMLRPPHADGGPGAVRVELRGERAGEGRVTVVYGAMDVPSVAAGAVAARAAARRRSTAALRRIGAGGLGRAGRAAAACWPRWPTAASRPPTFTG